MQKAFSITKKKDTSFKFEFGGGVKASKNLQLCLENAGFVSCYTPSFIIISAIFSISVQ